MKKFDYDTADINHIELQSLLDAMSEAGWKLYHISTYFPDKDWPNYCRHIVVFEREA